MMRKNNSFFECKKVYKQPPEVFCKKGVLRPATLLKRRLWHRCFPLNFVKFLRTFFTELLRATAFKSHKIYENSQSSFRKIKGHCRIPKVGLSKEK